MSTSIKQHAHDAVVATHKDHRPPGYVTRPIVARVRNLRLMTDIDPALIKHPSPLIRETLRISKRPPINPKQPRLLIIQDVTLTRLIHISFSCHPSVPLS